MPRAVWSLCIQIEDMLMEGIAPSLLYFYTQPYMINSDLNGMYYTWLLRFTHVTSK